MSYVVVVLQHRCRLPSSLALQPSCALKHRRLAPSDELQPFPLAASVDGQPALAGRLASGEKKHCRLGQGMKLSNQNGAKLVPLRSRALLRDSKLCAAYKVEKTLGEKQVLQMCTRPKHTPPDSHAVYKSNTGKCVCVSRALA